MQTTIDVGEYSPGSGLSLEWVSGYEIAVELSGNEVAIKANVAGLRSLAQHLTTLAEAGTPDGTHVHFEPGLELEDGSISLVLNRGL